MLDLSKLAIGLKGRAETVVSSEHLATHIGSGRAEVFASPMMIALIEAASVDCVENLLPAGWQSLGTQLSVAHIAPTPLGLKVEATAELTAIDGRSLTFKVEARDEKDVIGRGTHTRVVVDTPRFLAKVAAKTKTGS